MAARSEVQPPAGRCPKCGGRAIIQHVQGEYECVNGHGWNPENVHEEWSL